MYSNHLNMLNKEIKRFFEKPIPDQSLRIDKGFFFSVLGHIYLGNRILGDRTLKSSRLVVALHQLHAKG